MRHKELPLLEKSLRTLSFILSAAPSLYLLNGFLFDQLGLNPFERIMVVSGHTAQIMLVITLLITPLRQWLRRLFMLSKRLKWGKRLSDWNGLIRSRRMFGLFCFYYVSIHMWCYLDLELSLDWEELIYEIETRAFLIYGLIAWIILFVLSITSPRLIQRKMKRWWRRVHRLTYVLAILAAIHHLKGVKDTDQFPYLYITLFAFLLLYRLYAPLSKRFEMSKAPSDDGMEVYRHSSER